jgi:LVIVD repeat
MHTRWKALVATCVAALAFSGGSAMAHLPDDETGGTPLNSPWGEKFWFFANFQTAQNPFSAANTHVTSSDIAFWGDLAYVGDYGGFRIFDVSKPEPKEVADMRCYGPQGDPSVWDGDGDGEADTLALSVDSVLAGSQCGAGPVGKSSTTGKYPDGAWEGLRIFDVSDPAKPAQIAAVYQDCGSHTNTMLPAPDGKSMRILNSSYPLGEGPTCGPLGAAEGRKVNHGVVQVIDVPFDDPSQARELTELPVVYPGDADGTYKPVSDHGISAPLDDFLGCHDLSSFPKKGIVGAACGEQAQIWKIDKATGLPNTKKPAWAYDQTNVDFWHSATFSWDGEVANFIDESFGDGCPTMTTKTGGLPGGTRQFETGNMYFFDTKSGDLLSEYRNPRPSNDRLAPEGGDRLTYCSSHLGIPVPSRDRYLLVNAFYRGGSSVIDFTDPSAPREIAYADMPGTNTWTAYTYPRKSGVSKGIPVYSNDGLSRNYGNNQYLEAAYGFMRFRAEVGNTDLVGMNRLNPQLQEQVIRNSAAGKGRGGTAQTFATGKAAPEGATNRSARPWSK